MRKRHADINHRLQRILDQTVDEKRIFGATLCLESAKSGFLWSGGAGNLTSNTPYFIASTTKLYVTALLLILKAEGRLSFDDSIAKYLPPNILAGLHVLNGKEYSAEISIRQLMAHTSGLPDYFQGKPRGGLSLEKHITRGVDRGWSCEDAVALSKTMAPRFIPGALGKAHYSDTNFQLLGRITEVVTGTPLALLMSEKVFAPLKLEKTYLYSDPNDRTPQNLYFGSRALKIPKAMASFGPDGGIVSTAQDSLKFIRAFFGGDLFASSELGPLLIWNRAFFPFDAGTGILRFRLPWFFSPFRPLPELIGHSGLSGAFGFYCPKQDVYLAGTVNQIQAPGTSFRLMLKLLNQLP